MLKSGVKTAVCGLLMVLSLAVQGAWADAQDQAVSREAKDEIYKLAPTNVLANALSAERLAATRLAWTADLRTRYDRVVEILERGLPESDSQATEAMGGNVPLPGGTLETNCYTLMPLLRHSNSNIRHWGVLYVASRAFGAWRIAVSQKEIEDPAIRKEASAPLWCSDVAIPLLERSLFDKDRRIRDIALSFYTDIYPPVAMTNAVGRLAKLAATQGTNQIAAELWLRVHGLSTNLVPPAVMPIVQAEIRRRKADEAELGYYHSMTSRIPQDIMAELDARFDADLAAMGIPKEKREVCRKYVFTRGKLVTGQPVPTLSPEEQAEMTEFVKAWSTFRKTHKANVP